MAQVNIPLSVSDGVTKVYSADYTNNTFVVKSSLIPPSKATEIGDIYEVDFKPQIKIKRWMNDANLSVRVAGFTEGAEEVVLTAGDKIKYKKGGMEARFFLVPGENDDGSHHEMDVVLYDRPATNVIQYTITSKNLSFYKQPVLTQEEIDNGDTRPENVVGSYAVYHKIKVNDVWTQSKAMHIYRPKIWDAVGKEVWGELYIQAEQDGQFGIMTITIPVSFLNTAIYPVVVDPTFGYTTLGASGQNNRNNTVVANLFTPAYNGHVKSMHVGIYSGGAIGRYVQPAIYYSNQALFGYMPNNQNVVTGWNAYTTGAGPASPNFAITAGNQYYLCQNNNASNLQLAFDALAALSYEDPQTYGTWDATAAFTTKATRTYSVYASYLITYTYSATLSLGASKTILVKKNLNNANTQISAQYPGKYIAATTNVTINYSADNTKQITTSKDVDSALTSDTYKRSAIYKNTVVVLTSAITKFINSVHNAAATLTSLKSKRWEGETNVNLYPTSDQDIKTSKSFNSSVDLTADEANRALKDFDATTELLASIAKKTNKILYSDINVSSEEGEISDINLDTNIDVTSDTTKEVGKEIDSPLTVSASLDPFVIKKVISSDISLTGSESGGIWGNANVTLSLSPSVSILVIKTNNENTVVYLDTPGARFLIKKEINVSTTLIPLSDIEYGGMLRYVSMDLSASVDIRIIKNLNANLQLSNEVHNYQSAEGSVDISVTQDLAKRPMKVFEYTPPGGGGSDVFGTFAGYSYTDNSSARSICRTSNGDLHAAVVIANRQGPDYYKSVDGGATWTNEAHLSSDPWSQNNPCILADSNDKLHVLWHGVVGGSYNRVRYTTNKDGSWSSPQNIASGYNNWKPSACIDKDGYIHVVYKYWTSGVRYNKYIPAWDYWSGGYTIMGNSTVSPTDLAITVDSSSNVYVILRHLTDNLIYLKKYDKSLENPMYAPDSDPAAWWSPIQISTSGYAAYSPSVVLDSEENIHVIYDATSATSPSVRQLQYSKSTNGGVTWSTPLEITSEAYTQYSATLTIDQQDNLYVTFATQTRLDPTYRQMNQIKCIGGSWGGITKLTTGTTSWNAASGLYAQYPLGLTIPYQGSAAKVRGSSMVYVSSDFTMTAPPAGLRMTIGAEIDHEGMFGRTYESTVSLGASMTVLVKKSFSSSIDISGSSGEDVDYYRLAEVTLVLSAYYHLLQTRPLDVTITISSDTNKFIEKTINAALSLSSTEEASGDVTLAAQIILSASVTIGKHAYEDLSANFILIDQKAVKKVGKILTIREHSQSDYHHPCPKPYGD